MITDTLDHSELYTGLHPRLDAGLAWLRGADLAALPDGRHEIEGGDVFANVFGYTTASMDAKPYEAHEAFLDIQVVIAGEESLYWAPLCSLEEVDAYVPAKDVSFHEGMDGTPVTLRPGVFAVLFPQDAHKPGCHLHAAAPVRKVVVKVRIG